MLIGPIFFSSLVSFKNAPASDAKTADLLARVHAMFKAQMRPQTDTIEELFDDHHLSRLELVVRGVVAPDHRLHQPTHSSCKRTELHLSQRA